MSHSSGESASTTPKIPNVYSSFDSFFSSIIKGETTATLDIQNETIHNADIFLIQLRMTEDASFQKEHSENGRHLSPVITGKRIAAFVGDIVGINQKITRFQARLMKSESAPEHKKVFHCRLIFAENEQVPTTVDIRVTTKITPGTEKRAGFEVSTESLQDIAFVFPTARPEIIKALSTQPETHKEHGNGNGKINGYQILKSRPKPLPKKRIVKKEIDDEKEKEDEEILLPHKAGDIPLNPAYMRLWKNLTARQLKIDTTPESPELDREVGNASDKEITEMIVRKIQDNKTAYSIHEEAPETNRKIADFFREAQEDFKKRFRSDVVNRALSALAYLFSVALGKLEYQGLSRAKLIMKLIDWQKTYYDSLAPEQGQILETLLTQGKKAAKKDIEAYCKKLDKEMPNPFA